MEISARWLKVSHTYIEATKGIEQVTPKIDIFLQIFHELGADAKDMTLKKTNKAVCFPENPDKQFSD